MEKTRQVELLIRALRGVIHKFSSDKPKDYSTSSRDKSQDTCYICNEKGHWAPDCPKRKQKRDTSQDTCYHCQEKGHWSSNCPKKEQEKEEEEDDQVRNSEHDDDGEKPCHQDNQRHGKERKNKKQKRKVHAEEEEEKETSVTVKKSKK